MLVIKFLKFDMIIQDNNFLDLSAEVNILNLCYAKYILTFDSGQERVKLFSVELCHFMCCNGEMTPESLSFPFDRIAIYRAHKGIIFYLKSILKVYLYSEVNI